MTKKRAPALARTHMKMILEAVSRGERLIDIAARLGISQPAISQVLAHEPSYIAARESGTLTRIEHWEREIEALRAGDDQILLGRAREMLSHARWRAEREFPGRWGQARPAVAVSITLPSLDRALQRDLRSILESAAEPEQG